MNVLTTPDPPTERAERRRVLVRGLVQGVGFRPHVFRLARRYHLGGFVRNGPDGVVIEAEGSALDSFLTDLQGELPPLARIDTLTVTTIPIEGNSCFEIRETDGGRLASAAIPADTAICEDCLGELFNSSDRRYLHPFIACTNCGPRYTMTRRLPYDRASTAMADFDLCPACAAEYADPESRRFHAEPVCCHNCGPQLSNSIQELADAVATGKIVGLKGIGGFHLACDARNASAVARLRARKRRDARPFAVMVLNHASARLYSDTNAAEAQLLESRERPVVIVSGKRAGDLPEEISPGLDSLGLLLPYTPLHYLLFHALLGQPAGSEWLQQAHELALVMTSANISGDPLITDNTEARRELADIADLVVDHDRDIAARADDSVARIVDDKTLLIRRARGFVPRALSLGSDGKTVLGVGAHLKNSVCLLRGRQAWLSPHIGDLDSPASVRFQRDATLHLLDIMQETPAAIACDWHRDYASTRLAENLAEQFDVPLRRVQHHHAHIAAVLAVHQHEAPALGVALDGHGLGVNGESWGGELLEVSGDAFSRLGHFAELPAPGGDAAAREPWRMAAGALHLVGLTDEIAKRFPGEPLAPALQQLLEAGEYASTTAAGRLFDAAAGLLGLCPRAAFEAEPPMRLESLVRSPRILSDGFALKEGVLDFTALLTHLAHVTDPVVGAEIFHGTLVDALVAWARDAAERTGIDTVALAGGCFLNGVLAREVPRRLTSSGLRPLLAETVPPNDGSISLGQAWIARRSLTGPPLKLEVLN